MSTVTTAGKSSISPIRRIVSKVCMKRTTFQCLKAIADLYAFHQKSEGKTELDICFEHFAEAITIFEDLGMIKSKGSILTLKNFGQCHMIKGNINEAMSF